MSPAGDIVIVGAGIIGLDVALVLCQQGLGRHITIVAQHLPGDTAVTYTSPWAGCNFSAISGTDANALRWDQAGYKYLMGLAGSARDSKEAFVQRVESVEYWDEQVPKDKIQHMARYLEDFQAIPANELPAGVSFGAKFTTVTINAPKHLLYLASKLRDEYGVTFVRKTLGSLEDVCHLSSSTTGGRRLPKIVFNCTGNASRSLPGVQDIKCYPTRGQVVLARCPGSSGSGKMMRNMMRHGVGYETYVIPRPGTDGHVILGGYMQKGNSDGSTYLSETESILSRTAALSPDLNNAEVLAAFAGLRPSREGGARVERDPVGVAAAAGVVAEGTGTTRVLLVHNYGAGGTGFQAGYGMALDAVESAADVLGGIIAGAEKARL
ncbi:FAD dependent oxidoreductase [Microdochium bolleyi]|uniref:FAD dependent oxidoreductase n=1 Tax=Microdochium bolleyi TaxID=196109 RepID=A0A136IXZ1_9PEZI|nr:FAD dependent oxidoreductase [Microdochium bolleyi]